MINYKLLPKTFVLLLLVSGLWACHDAEQRKADENGQQHAKVPMSLDLRQTHVGLEIPFLKPSDKLVKHAAYSLVYSEEHEQALWIAYEFTDEETQSVEERYDNFMDDPLVLTGSATDGDYYKSGFDRGHLAPAGDMAWSEKAMKESFYYSNVSPMYPRFNRGIWKELEAEVRKWAAENDVIYVVTGPVLKDGLSKIGESGVSVPYAFYKVILDYNKPGLKGIGFLMPHTEDLTGDPVQFAVSIDSVEKVTGIDFFHLLEDGEEAKLESQYQFADWANGLPGQGDVPETDPEQASESSGRQYIQGPRGGCYYITDGGNKVYVDRSYCED